MQNLNRATIPASEGPDRPLADHSTTANGTTVYFRELESHLLRHIDEADAVLGAVAWLTSEPVLNALATKQSVSFVVQKEDFLRPDITVRPAYTDWLKTLYDRLPGSDRCYQSGILGQMSVGGGLEIDGVRCVGNYNAAKNPAFPRMHNKFLVFCNYEEAQRMVLLPESAWEVLDARISPYAVWTGSFNMTQNATRSLENALYITEPALVNAYYQEWNEIMALSESLDWEASWIAPEWRIGS